MRSNPPYQVDCSNAASGKRLSTTKRRVSFRFGFSNRDAIANGLTGNACRGEEHEVVLIWSLTSGKRSVAYDGKEVHHSVGRRAEVKFEASWSIPGNHMLKIVAHAVKPVNPYPGFQQYDFFLDGMSFFTMPSIYELGTQGYHGRSNIPATVPVQSYDSGNPYKNNAMHGYHEQHGADNYYSTSNANPHKFNSPSRRSTPDTIPMDTPTSSMTGSFHRTAVPEDVLSAEAPAPVDLPHSPTAVPANTMDEFTPVIVQPAPTTFQDVSNSILSAYGPTTPAPPTPAPLALANESHTHYTQQMQHAPNAYSPNAAYHQQQQYTPQSHQHQQGFYQNPPQQANQSAFVSPDGFNGHGFNAPQDPTTASPPKPASVMVTPNMTMMKPLDVDELRDSPAPVDEMEQALQNLVNLGDLMETRATPEQIKAKKQKEVTKKQNKSVALPAANTSWHVAQNASLADIQTYKTPKKPTKEVMRIHAFDPAAAQAGMMVVYGQQQQQQQASQQAGLVGGIPAASGFGNAVHRGYSHQPYPMHCVY